MKLFNNGWGSQWAMSQYARSLLKPLYDQLSETSLVIDSTWYTDEYNLKVQDWIKNNPVDKIVLTAFNDAGIVNQTMFDRPVYEVGYYNGPQFIDFWAHVVRDKYQLPSKEELLNYKQITKPYLSYNRKPHEHRLELYNDLVARNIIDQGIVTMNDQRQLDNDVEEYIKSAPVAGSVIVNDILTLGRQDIWNQCFLNIVTETWPDINRAYFVSEKIYKPIVGMRPFFVYAEDLGNKWLKDRGFETYENDFKDIYPNTITKDNLVDFLVILCDVSKNINWLQTKFIALKEKLIYNEQQFYKYVDKQDINKVIETIL